MDWGSSGSEEEDDIDDGDMSDSWAEESDNSYVELVRKPSRSRPALPKAAAKKPAAKQPAEKPAAAQVCVHAIFFSHLTPVHCLLQS